jgi:hypothetical protein
MGSLTAMPPESVEGLVFDGELAGEIRDHGQGAHGEPIGQVAQTRLHAEVDHGDDAGHHQQQDFGRDDDQA